MFRWPSAVFYNILDILAYITCVLFNTRLSAQGIDSSSRVCFKFLCSFGEQLLKPNIL